MKDPITCVNVDACLSNAARRLRYLRTFPFTCANGEQPTPAECFDYALRVMLDEFMQGGTSAWHHLYHHTEGEFGGEVQ